MRIRKSNRQRRKSGRKELSGLEPEEEKKGPEVLHAKLPGPFNIYG